MTHTDLSTILTSLPLQQRNAVLAAISDWEEITQRHGEAGAFALALLALRMMCQDTPQFH